MASASEGPTWIMELRCRYCYLLFTVKGVVPTTIAHAEAAKCPHCGHEPAKSFGASFDAKTHSIVQLKRER